MKPVRSRKIGASEGEFLYRKSSKAEPVACSVSCVQQSSYVGCSGNMCWLPRLGCALSGSGYRPLFRHRNAFG